MRVGDEELGPGELVAPARRPRLERDALRVPARARLELRQRDAQRARCELREQLLLLHRAAALEQRDAAQDHRREERAGLHDAAHLLEDDDQVDEVEARAAVLLGQDEAHPAEPRHLLPLLVAEAPLVLHHLADVGHGAFLGEEVARRLAEHLLLFAEAEVHPGSLP